MTSLDERGRIFLKCHFFLFPNIYPLGKGGDFHLKKREPYSPSLDALYQVWLKWSCDSGKEDKNLKSLQTDVQKDGRTNNGRQVISKAQKCFIYKKKKCKINKFYRKSVKFTENNMQISFFLTIT